MRMKKNILAGVCFWVLVSSCGCGSEGSTVIIGGAEYRDGNFSAEDPGETLPNAEGGAPEGQETMIRVYVCGAVVNPGVVTVPEGSRAEDALWAAGGFCQDAGRTAVNLADWVADGQMLYFPTQEEALEMESLGTQRESGLVNINTADAALLCTLPGIGEGRAADIIAYREENGGFESCEDIMKVSGIKDSVYEKIRDKITVR